MKASRLVKSSVFCQPKLYFSVNPKTVFINISDENYQGGRKEVNKTSIKVIKRKDAEVMANAQTQNACEPKEAPPVSEEKIERHSRREIVNTVSTWISERRENNRVEEIAAIRKVFGGEPLLS
jgi:hypothetical protein